MKRQKSSIIKFVSVALAAILITSAVAVSAETVKSENAKITAIYNTNDENAYRAYRQKKSNFNNAEEDIIIDGEMRLIRINPAISMRIPPMSKRVQMRYICFLYRQTRHII